METENERVGSGIDMINESRASGKWGIMMNKRCFRFRIDVTTRYSKSSIWLRIQNRQSTPHCETGIELAG